MQRCGKGNANEVELSCALDYNMAAKIMGNKMKIKRLSSRALHSHFIFILHEYDLKGCHSCHCFCIRVSISFLPFSILLFSASEWVVCGGFFFLASLHVPDMVYFCNMLSPQLHTFDEGGKKLNAHENCWSRCHIAVLLSFTLTITTMWTISAVCVFCQTLVVLIDIFYILEWRNCTEADTAYAQKEWKKKLERKLMLRKKIKCCHEWNSILQSVHHFVVSIWA